MNMIPGKTLLKPRNVLQVEMQHSHHNVSAMVKDFEAIFQLNLMGQKKIRTMLFSAKSQLANIANRELTMKKTRRNHCTCCIHDNINKSIAQYRFTVPHKISERYCTSERNNFGKKLLEGSNFI